MEKFKSILLTLGVIVLTALAIACTGKSEGKAEESQAHSKYLVLYYSQTGATKAVAEELRKALGADIEPIVAEEPYDGTFEETIRRCDAEREGGIVPKVKPLEANIEDYDTIFLGYPIWYGTYARPILGLLEASEFKGKTIVPFCTFGSGGLESLVRDLKAALPEATIADGYGVRAARIGRMPAELNRFLIEYGYAEGEIEPLAPFSEMADVTDKEKAIFDEATSGYQFPLGTPIQCGMRKTPDGVEYAFSVRGATPEGQDAQSTIYVTVDSEEGSKPEFTRVVL